MPMSSGGPVASSSDYATKPKAQEIGLTGYPVPTPRSSHIGHYVMATAEHREPCDSRGSCTVLGAPGGEIPPGDSTMLSKNACRKSLAAGETLSACSWVGVTAWLANTSPKLPFHLRNRRA